MTSKNLLTFTGKGIYCEQGDFFIDPWKPVRSAIITHGHADHSRFGSDNYLCHRDSVGILRHRLGSIRVEGIPYGHVVTVRGVKVSLYPAGHLLGSAQVLVEYKGERWCASGDYKVQSDPIAEDFVPVKCDAFITECTFGLPVYNWPDTSEVIHQIEQWWRENQAKGQVTLLSAYSLGKAQRVLELLNESIGPLYAHGAVHSINQVHRRAGFLQKEIRYLDPAKPATLQPGALVVAPPSAIGSTWANRLKPYSVGVVSGWMMLRGSKRRANVDRGFVLSDHADWKGLNEAIKETGAERVICTHGYTDTFSEWLRSKGYNATTEKTLFEGETLNEKEGEGE